MIRLYALLECGEKMDSYNLLEFAADFGYALSVSGAETFRVEDSVSRILASYGVDSEVFAIPNLLIISIRSEDGKPITRMKRIGNHGNNLDAVERLNALSRQLCAAPLPPEQASARLSGIISSIPSYSFPVHALGSFLGAVGFALLFGCTSHDMLISGICGVITALSKHYTDGKNVNAFFSTILAAFLMSLAAYTANLAGLAANVDGIVIGALMLLVPGLLFTNAMRDFLFGDVNSGINRIAQVIMIAIAISIGTACAWNGVCALWGLPTSSPGIEYPVFINAIGALIGCIGFSILFNIHGPGGILCALGGVLTWVIYECIADTAKEVLPAYFAASFFAAAYSEIMARIRKYPAISYLVVSLFPLLPGAGVYYTLNYALHGFQEEFLAQGMHTAAIAGVIAVAVMFVSTAVRLLLPPGKIAIKNVHA